MFFGLEIILSTIGIIYLTKRYRIQLEDYYTEPSLSINVLPDKTRIWYLFVFQLIASLLLIYSYPEKLYGGIFWVIAYTEASVILFLVGWRGMKQIPLKQVSELAINKEEDVLSYALMTNQQHNQILQKILSSFSEEKYFLKRELTLEDLAQKVGTNRTYVSKIINEHSGQNFCSFVNEYRINEMMRILKSDDGISLRQLAEVCGFGSVDSMKRAVMMKTGMSIYALKKTNQE